MPPKLKVKYYLDTSICKQDICFDPKCAGLSHFPLGPVGYIKNESRADQSRYVPATGGSWLVQMDGGKNRICWDPKKLKRTKVSSYNQTLEVEFGIRLNNQMSHEDTLKRWWKNSGNIQGVMPVLWLWKEI